MDCEGPESAILFKFSLMSRHFQSTTVAVFNRISDVANDKRWWEPNLIKFYFLPQGHLKVCFRFHKLRIATLRMTGGSEASPGVQRWRWSTQRGAWWRGKGREQTLNWTRVKKKDEHLKWKISVDAVSKNSPSNVEVPLGAEETHVHLHLGVQVAHAHLDSFDLKHFFCKCWCQDFQTTLGLESLNPI